MSLRAVFFDLDGTLLDTSRDLGNALNRLRGEYQLPAIEHAVIRQHVSNGANALVKLGFGDTLSDAEHQRYRARLLELYLADIASFTEPFVGISEVIGELDRHHIQWGIVTNKPQQYTEALMAHFAFASPPSATVSPDQVGVGKPAPAPLLKACELSGCHPSEALYVGDHERDVQCAHAAGMPAIAVGYGFTDQADDHHHWAAEHTAATAFDIWPIIESYLDTD